MGEKKMNPVEKVDYEEYVTYTAPAPTRPNEADMLVGVNGEIIRIKRGETVKIKRKFLEVIQNAERQKAFALKAMIEAQEVKSILM